METNKKRVVITRYEENDFFYYEATFKNGNLYAFSIYDLVSQLVSIYGMKSKLFSYLFCGENKN